jgi:predicted acyl esterase
MIGNGREALAGTGVGLRRPSDQLRRYGAQPGRRARNDRSALGLHHQHLRDRCLQCLSGWRPHHHLQGRAARLDQGDDVMVLMREGVSLATDVYRLLDDRRHPAAVVLEAAGRSVSRGAT